MNGRNDTPKSRGRITAPRRENVADANDSLTLADIPDLLHTKAHRPEKIHLNAPKQPAHRSAPSAVSQTATPHTPDTKVLAGQRAALGFDDIPVASPGEIEKERARRERAGTWAKDSRFGRLLKGKGLRDLKEDLQWAIDADQGVDERTAKRPVDAVADKPQPQETTKTIDINISFGELPKLPKISRPANPLANLPRFVWTRRTKKIGAGIVIGAGVIAILYSLPVTQQFLPSSKNEGPALSTGSTPDYQTILPAGKSASSVAWQRVSPPDRDPVFAYSDTIDGVKIAVSQQPVPDTFKPNVSDNVANLAKSYAATDKVAADDTQLYVGTSGQGPQSVIFTKNGLLVLIKSSSKIPDASWARYVQSLQNGPHY